MIYILLIITLFKKFWNVEGGWLAEAFLRLVQKTEKEYHHGGPSPYLTYLLICRHLL